MRILLIDVNCKKGSTGKIVYDLFTDINNNGDIATICYGRGRRIKENGVFKFGIDVETYFHALLTRISGFTGYFSFFSTKKLLHYIKKFNPDVVHIHELHAYFVNIKPLLRYLKDNKIRTVMTLHCEYIYTGKCGHTLDCNKWKKECHHCPRLHDYISTWFFDNTRRMYYDKKMIFTGFDYLTIVAPSKWLLDRCKKSFLKDYKMHVIHNGIETSIFHPREVNNFRQKLNVNSDEKIVLSVAPRILSEIKGGEHILRIADILYNEKIRFILIGAEEIPEVIPKNVIIEKAVYDQNELAKYYSVADLFLICSKKENYPTTCLEAQACGTPVVGFDVGGTKETAGSKYCEFVEYGDVDALAVVIKSTLLNSKEYKNTLLNDYDKYSKKIMYKKYNEIYYG